MCCSEKIESELAALGVSASTVDGILTAVSMRSLDDMAALLGADSEAVQDLQRLFALAEGYGYKVNARSAGREFLRRLNLASPCIAGFVLSHTSVAVGEAF